MALDHSGHQRGAGQVDRSGARGCGEVRPDGCDAVALDEHGPAFVRDRSQAVENTSGTQEERVGSRRDGKHDGDQEQDQAAHYVRLC